MSRILRLTVYSVLLAVLAAAPAWAQQVNADWDKAAKFDAFKTYAWTKGTIPATASPLMVQRAQSAVEAELAAVGLLKVDKDSDVLVALHAATKEETSLQSWGYGPRWGMSGQIDVNKVLVGMLVIDVIDARAKKLAFRATATDTVSDNPQKNEKKIMKAVEKMFEKYPGNAPK